MSTRTLPFTVLPRHFLDPLRAPGGTGKRRKIPVLAALRISASACLFATNDHHAAHGIRAMWRQRVRGLYLASDALLRTLNCLTDLGFFDSTFQSLEHAMSCAVELDVGLPRPLDLLIYCTDFISTPAQTRSGSAARIQRATTHDVGYLFDTARFPR